MKIVLVLIVAYFAYQYFLGDESGCDKYASKFSCDYIESKADYDVYFWHNFQDEDPNDDKYIGSTTGLSSCRNLALNYADSISEKWHERAYICVLKKDGNNMEKHRL